MTQNPDDDQHRRAQRLRNAQQAANATRRATLDTHQAAAETTRAHELAELAQLQTRVETVRERTAQALQQQGEAITHTASAEQPRSDVRARVVQS